MLSHTSFRTKAVAIAALFLAPAAACADIVVPDGLSPGETYHLAFLTSGTRDAMSTDIADYNSFVNDQAELSGAITTDWDIDWFAIGSTATTNARTNAVVSAPVYLLDGTTLIAEGIDDMWDGNLENNIDMLQDGQTGWQTDVWVGTNPFTGTASDLGIKPLGYYIEEAGTGVSFYHDEEWAFYQYGDTGDKKPMYALSEQLTVPSANPIPEPSMLLAWAGLATAGVWVSRRRRRKP